MADDTKPKPKSAEIFTVNEMPRFREELAREDDEPTAAMIHAGCAALALCESADPPWQTVRDVYLAMRKAWR